MSETPAHLPTLGSSVSLSAPHRHPDLLSVTLDELAFSVNGYLQLVRACCFFRHSLFGASLVVQSVKNPPAM